MKARLFLCLALVLICSGAALAQTPDGETPADETVCDSETGAAYGLCNAYCEAMDCESDEPAASETACTKVRSKFQNITGRDLPCEAVAATCPCADLPGWNVVFDGVVSECADGGSSFVMVSGNGSITAAVDPSLPSGGICTVSPPVPPTVLNITPAQAEACVTLLRRSCTFG